jgi:O-succinylbenzoic acid--CoA ligase
MPLALSTVRPTIVRLDDLLSLRARTHADRPAVVAGGHTITYAELDARTGVTSRRLAALGLGPGQRVATTLPPGADFAALLHAAARLRATLVPLNTRLTGAELRAQVEDAAVHLVVEEPPDGAEADLVPAPPLDPDQPWTLLFTSGTSGRPKPVLLSHRNHLASAVSSAWALGVAPDDRWLAVLPVFHVGGLAILIRSALYGTAVAVHERFEPGSAATALGGGEVTLASLVPTMLQRVLEAGVRPSRGLRAILVGGAPAPEGLLARAAAHGLPVVRTYGMTETASQVATARVAADGAVAGARARPLPGVEISIGAAGEVLVRGPMVATGALARDGWLHTGDRGQLDGEGVLHVDGRIDHVIVTGGENVAAGEVEEVLLAHPAVREAAVVGTPDSDWGAAVTAFVVASASVDATELRDHCRGRIAPFKVPKDVLIVDYLPRNAAGKVERRALAERAGASPE